MGAVQKQRIWDAQALSGAAHTSTDTAKLDGSGVDYVGVLNLSAIGAGTTCTVKLQDSFDSITWFDFITFTGKTATGTEVIAATRPPFPNVRGSAAFTGGTTTGTVTLDLAYGSK